MRLLSLELQGFKSFPDRTVLKFAQGVTTVVGPNGSGKSNISDAVRWVFGEISAKSMRGTKMEDVIFGGTDKRKPMNYAEVSITFDNREEDGYSRIPIDYDEVTITRRYSRNETSEYMINRNKVRAMDISALFMNTGIGRNGYSIIGQGKAAEIISQKSDERRNVFEEAAGISKYRNQKNDAERKLAETVLNCERLADILNEKKIALDRLEKDSERAKRYLEIYEKKKESEVSLAVYDIRHNRKKLQELSAKNDTLKAALMNADNSINDATVEKDRVDILKNSARESALTLTTKIEDYTTQRFDKDSGAKVLENEVTHIKSKIREITEKIESLTEKSDVYVEEVVLAENEFSEVNAKKESAEKNRDGIIGDISKLNAEIDELDIKIENLTEEMENVTSEIDGYRLRTAELEGSHELTEKRKIEIKRDIENNEKSAAVFEEGKSRQKQNVDNYKRLLEEFSLSGQKNSQKLSELRKETERLNSEIISVVSDIRDNRTRADTLRRMEELFEGYPHSVSAVMNASKLGKLSGIIGPLSHVFSVNGEYSLAIETALGSNIQNIVCDTDEAAKSAVWWLKQNNAGRTTFYPLNTMQPGSLSVDIKDLSKHKGFIGIASELVEYEQKFKNVIENLLGRTVVFDNLDNANATSKAYGYRLRIVTKDGQLVNAGGSITGGAAKRETGVLNRSATIDRLNADRIVFEQNKKELETKYQEKLKETEELEASMQGSIIKEKALNTLYQAALTEYNSLDMQLKSNKELVSRLGEQLVEIETLESKAENEKKSITENIRNLGDRLTEIKRKKTGFSEEKEVLTDKLNKFRESLHTISVVVMSFGKDVEALDKNLTFKRQMRDDCERELNACKGQIVRLQDELEKTVKKIEESFSMAQKLGNEVLEMVGERDEAQKKVIEYEQRILGIEIKIREFMRSREILSTDNSKVESQIENINSDLDKSVGDLINEYNLTFSEAEKLDYPEVTPENRAEVSQKLTECKYKLRGIGSVDPTTIEEYQVAKTAYDELNANLEDMEKSRKSFEQIVQELETEMKTRFVSVMEEINEAFNRVFRELFGGGSASLLLVDPEDVLHCGIDIKVAPPGKIIKNLSALSGGEQAFVSIALFFAILNVNPSPFCILDEVEAALDEVNVAMFANYIKKYSDKTQFITITHRRGTMEVADTLYGVTMAERGISRVLTLNVNEVESKLGVKL